MTPEELQEHFIQLHKISGIEFTLQERLLISRYLRALEIPKNKQDPTQLELFE